MRSSLSPFKLGPAWPATFLVPAGVYVCNQGGRVCITRRSLPAWDLALLEIGRHSAHMGPLAEWDGTKKKVRAWEQGREKNKVKMESFRLGDLRSGEVRVWRIVGREWVGWDS